MGVTNEVKMNFARTLAPVIAGQAPADLPAGVLPDPWENIEPEGERGKLEEQYYWTTQAIKGAPEEERTRLLIALDNLVGERLALELTHAEEFRAHDKQFFVEA